MKMKIATLILAAAALGCAGGCDPAAAEFIVDLTVETLSYSKGFSVTPAVITSWDVPSEIDDPGTYRGVDLGCYYDWGFGIALGYYGGDGEWLWTGVISWDIGENIALHSDRDPDYWLIFRPEWGFWSWSAPDGGLGADGFLAGLATGISIRTGTMGPDDTIELGYSWQHLVNVEGNKDADLGKVFLSYVWRY